VTRDALEAFYRRYNAACNAHEFERLGEFVADDVWVNGEQQGLAGYVAGLEDVVARFPDYRWDLQHLLIDGDWLAAHFVDTGTHEGRAVTTHELALYRIVGERIVEVFVAADDLSVLEQLR
jgi:predicted ester cyclase